VSRGARLAILPRRDGDPVILPTPLLSEEGSPSEILRCAEGLGIPWKRLLLTEIETEQRLRRYLADVENDCSLPSAMTILSHSFLQSWRVRDRIQSLAARTGEDAAASTRQLRSVFRRLTEGSDQGEPALTEHLWFAYQRVLLLQRVGRSAARSRGTSAERVGFVCSRTHCCFEDASWAVAREESRGVESLLDAAVRKVRGEGFLIPRARTEARSLSELRRLVRGIRKRAARLVPGGSSRYPVSAPRPLELADAVGIPER
jgi:hypothetical protein